MAGTFVFWQEAGSKAAFAVHRTNKESNFIEMVSTLVGFWHSFQFKEDPKPSLRSMRRVQAEGGATGLPTQNANLNSHSNQKHAGGSSSRRPELLNIKIDLQSVILLVCFFLLPSFIGCHSSQPVNSATSLSKTSSVRQTNLRPSIDDQWNQIGRPRAASSAQSRDQVKPVIDATTWSSGKPLQIKGPGSNPNKDVWIQGQVVDKWRLGSYEVYQLMRPRCRQGDLTASANQAIVWVDHNSRLPEVVKQVDTGKAVHVAVVYLEGNVEVNYFTGRQGNGNNQQGGQPNRAVQRAAQWLHSFYSYQDIAVKNPPRIAANGISFDRKLRDRGLKFWQDQEPVSNTGLAARGQTSAAVGIHFPVTKELGVVTAGASGGDSSFVAPATFLGGQATSGSAQNSSPFPSTIGNNTSGNSPLAAPNAVPLGHNNYQPSHAPAGLGTPNLGVPDLSTGGNQIPPTELHPAFRRNLQPGKFHSGSGSPGSSSSSASFGYGGPIGGSAQGGPGSGRVQGQGGLSGSQLDQVQRVQIFPRSTGVDLNVQNVPGRVPGEQMILATGGVKVVIVSPTLATGAAAAVVGNSSSGQLIIQADNLVAWTNQLPSLGGRPGAPRWELFLEGNVVFSIGNRIVNASKMYYDVNQKTGAILDVEMLTPVPNYSGLVRMRADVLHQLNMQQFQANRASVTTSRIGQPRYWIQSETLNLRRDQAPKTDPVTGITPIDPQTGQLLQEDSFTLESRRNYIYLWNRPILFWPVFKTKLEEPEYYLKGLSVKNDSVFGLQVLTDWNMYQVLGRDPVPGTKWTGGLDYLSKRGIGLESIFTYRQANSRWLPGRSEGKYDSWFLLSDDGQDNLGADRRTLIPEQTSRGRSLWTHRSYLSNGDRINGQLGWVSDRNFLEQFYEREWDQRHDMPTNIEWERVSDNRRFSVLAQGNINDFFTQTQWLPKVEGTLLGHSILGGPWSVNTKAHVGYADLKVADAPTDPTDLAKFDPLAWEAEREGLRMGVRSEISRPLQLGAMKLTPYALGDATYWGEDLTGNDLTRLYGQFGFRTGLPMWKVDPSIRSEIWNLNGLAHKVNFYSHFFYADANKDLDQLPLYDPLDDDAQEHFRRRFAFDTFGIVAGGNVAARFDERTFALRSGLQSYVTSVANEIADDQMQFQMGVHQRWQTKRGAPGRERVIDWVTLDMKTTIYPRESRDNFGGTFGNAEFDFKWHIGDRLTLLSDGYFDSFDNGLKTASLGLRASRPLLGDLYLGIRTIDGPINADVVNAQVNYRLSPKWIVKASTSWDFGNTGQIGQLFSAVYIGESFLWQVGTHTDFSRDNVGFVFSVEPRVLPKGKLGRLGGVTIPPPGVLGLE